MLTAKKITTYNKYSGDIDMWARMRKSRELEIMSDEDWTLIDELIQNIGLIEKGLASKAFEAETINKLNEVCDSIETKVMLENMAKPKKKWFFW